MNAKTQRTLAAFANNNNFPLTKVPVEASEATAGDTIKSGYGVDVVDGKVAHYRMDLEHEDTDPDELMKIAIISIEQSAATIKKCVMFLATVVAVGLAAGLLAMLLLLI